MTELAKVGAKEVGKMYLVPGLRSCQILGAVCKIYTEAVGGIVKYSIRIQLWIMMPGGAQLQ